MNRHREAQLSHCVWWWWYVLIIFHLKDWHKLWKKILSIQCNGECHGGLEFLAGVFVKKNALVTFFWRPQNFWNKIDIYYQTTPWHILRNFVPKFNLFFTIFQVSSLRVFFKNMMEVLHILPWILFVETFMKYVNENIYLAARVSSCLQTNFIFVIV